MSVQKLQDKVALVSGSGRGIGRAVAVKLASEGARVVVNDLDPEPAKEVVAEIESAGGQAVACIGSVTDPEFADRFVTTAVDNFGGVDIIVNNAGYTWDSVIQKMTDKQWADILDVHLTAPFRILRAAQPVISAAVKREREQGSVPCRKVVNISSTSGLLGNPGQANYSSAKAGMVGLTKTIAKEWGRYNVTSNAVAYGVISTRLTSVTTEAKTIKVEDRDIRVGMDPAVMEAATKGIALGRAGTVEEAAGAVYLLCSPESSYITGQVLVCGGGL
ncbi:MULTISPECIES: SDR family NAD(P)-dependent oxidoreductase [Gordonia]|uniref:3-oxoacyl-[acyl-carrier-protein] reductase MabA n=2 Tax=Gordonia terrae TaxID=2055 RepID=A0AAD0P0A1_9ACTN|nr:MULTISPECIES: SDR family oxidoreductase [Gordonia]VTR10530.1 3-ketoacyl-ACP reductase [Clostridioides difficile]ANY24151.1 3-oxoacyl-ACP reductase [Gordonia terrae]AWO84894.1 KR domain-containing protein [Gordonia terrae]MCG7633609.1 SDR family oxidoreductase [Gordonia sp. McavH-238-E]VTS57325.1 3-oxoacyl-[acyl-carrier-protein] reductase FabG [Gordonia terrae]